MNYLKHSAYAAAGLSVLVAVLAISAVVIGAVAFAAVGCFLILFPLVLMTKPALKRAAKAAENKLRAINAHTEAAEAAKQAEAKPASEELVVGGSITAAKPA